MHWLDGLHAALQRAPLPPCFFFRDDDAGWADDRLFALLDLFHARRTPIDLAVIPAALTDTLARRLRARREQAPSLLGLHQHGFSHANHEAEGRKCEFGPARTRLMQRDDIARGRAVLERAIETLDPIFTPPWNRCTQATAQALVELGFETLSRDAGATPLRIGRLNELPVCVDWCKEAGAIQLRAEGIARRIASAVERAAPVGIMLHHAVMDDADLRHLDELLVALHRLPGANLALMRDAAAVCAVRTVRDDLPSLSR